MIRDIITKSSPEREEGYREQLKDGVWLRINNSNWYRYRAPTWLKGGAVDMMREIGIETDRKSATSFFEASDSSFPPFYYLAIAAENGVGAEALKWIMSNMAAEINERKLTFNDLPKLISATKLNSFLLAVIDGRIERNFAKPIFSELLCGANLETLIVDPRFKAAGDEVIDDALDQIIRDNPDQFEKAVANPRIIQWFVGQVMKATQGKAKPNIIIEKMEARISAVA